jgi:hypothetical protein
VINWECEAFSKLVINFMVGISPQSKVTLIGMSDLGAALKREKITRSLEVTSLTSTGQVSSAPVEKQFQITL